VGVVERKRFYGRGVAPVIKKNITSRLIYEPIPSFSHYSKRQVSNSDIKRADRVSQLVIHIKPKPGLQVAAFASAGHSRLPRQHEVQNLTSRLQESLCTPSQRRSVDLASAFCVVRRRSKIKNLVLGILALVDLVADTEGNQMELRGRKDFDDLVVRIRGFWHF
jgi:hypothetical protein